MVTPEALLEHWRCLEGLERAVSPLPGLRAHQCEGAAILAERLKLWRCAILADAVGTGKSYTALGVVALLSGKPTIVCPPALRSQWSKLLERRSVDAELVSDGVLSRREVRSTANGLVIVDEGHRFRTPSTRRRANLLRLIGLRPVLWLTATPVWNTRRDLLQLVGATVGEAIFQRSVGLSLGQCLERIDEEDGLWAAVCERFVLRRSAGTLNERHELRFSSGVVPAYIAAQVIAAAPRAMVFPGEPASLYQQGVARRLASSAEAAAASLRRGIAFLGRLEEAQRTGASITRSEFATTFGAELGAPAQCVMPFWFLRGALQVPDVADRREELLAALYALECHPFAQSEKALVLCDVASRATKVLVFTEFQVTAEEVWRTCRPFGNPVLVTGSRASVQGVGEVDRATALSLFREGEPRLGLEAKVLVLTPVGAEGLNLQCADMVVHADLAWNEARMEQRVGRADRLGGSGRVWVIRFRPPADVESACRLERVLSRKARLAHIPQRPHFEAFTTCRDGKRPVPYRARRLLITLKRVDGELRLGEGELTARLGGEVVPPGKLLAKILDGESFHCAEIGPCVSPPVRVPMRWVRRMRRLEQSGQLPELRELLRRLEHVLTECGEAGRLAVVCGDLSQASHGAPSRRPGGRPLCL